MQRFQVAWNSFVVPAYERAAAKSAALRILRVGASMHLQKHGSFSVNSQSQGLAQLKPSLAMVIGLKRFSMKIWLSMAPLLLVLAGLSLFIRRSSNATEQRRPEGREAAAGEDRIPVLVELFTSEGCSSCPPADELLATLDEKQSVPGVEIIALEQHVDYWNSLGWKDPFSSRRFSERQSEYAASFGRSGVYTPQMIVDGTVEFVGSSRRQALSSIAESARRAKAKVRVQVAGNDGNPAASIPLAVSVEMPSETAAGGDADLVVAVTENDVASNISRGENAGLHVVHGAVVRDLRTIGAVKPGRSLETELDLQLDKDWNRERLRVVVFLQDRSNRQILGAAAAGLGKGA